MCSFLYGVTNVRCEVRSIFIAISDLFVDKSSFYDLMLYARCLLCVYKAICIYCYDKTKRMNGFEICREP